MFPKIAAGMASFSACRWSANTTLASLGSISKNGFLRFAEEQKAALSFISRLSVKTPSPKRSPEICRVAINRK